MRQRRSRWLVARPRDDCLATGRPARPLYKYTALGGQSCERHGDGDWRARPPLRDHRDGAVSTHRPPGPDRRHARMDRQPVLRGKGCAGACGLPDDRIGERFMFGLRASRGRRRATRDIRQPAPSWTAIRGRLCEARTGGVGSRWELLGPRIVGGGRAISRAWSSAAPMRLLRSSRGRAGVGR